MHPNIQALKEAGLIDQGSTLLSLGLIDAMLLKLKQGGNYDTVILCFPTRSLHPTAIDPTDSTVKPKPLNPTLNPRT